MAKVLLIESDKLLARNIQDYLNSAGHEVFWHVDLQEAMNWADDNQPKAVIIDLLMPGRSGIEFLYELRSYPDWSDLPVIIFSVVAAEGLKDCLDNLEQLNIAGYHYKPMTTLARLNETLSQALQPVSV